MDKLEKSMQAALNSAARELSTKESTLIYLCLFWIKTTLDDLHILNYLTLQKTASL